MVHEGLEIVRSPVTVVDVIGVLPNVAAEDRLDRIEIVSVDDGEVLLYWTVPAKLASKLLRELRADLAALPAEEFIDKWAGADAEDLF